LLNIRSIDGGNNREKSPPRGKKEALERIEEKSRQI
jgi:hypothetical protein